MPQLKQLSCCIQWSDTNAPFQEYGTVYGDGVVESFIVVPNKPQGFCIRLTSRGYISTGLSMVVFIDGNYQCNRTRVNLCLPKKGSPANKTEIDFLLRQKEKAHGDGIYMGREWRFDNHNVVAEAPEGCNECHFDDLGTIEVLVLRCRAASPADAEYEGSSSGEDSDIFGNRTAQEDHEDPTLVEKAEPAIVIATSPAKPATAADPVEDDGLPMMALFDGANDYQEFNHDGGHDGQSGRWVWHQKETPQYQHPLPQQWHPPPPAPHHFHPKSNNQHDQYAYAGRNQEQHNYSNPASKRVHFDDGPHHSQRQPYSERGPRQPPNYSNLPQRPPSRERVRSAERRSFEDQRQPHGAPYGSQQVSTGQNNNQWENQYPRDGSMEDSRSRYDSRPKWGYGDGSSNRTNHSYADPLPRREEQQQHFVPTRNYSDDRGGQHVSQEPFPRINQPSFTLPQHPYHAADFPQYHTIPHPVPHYPYHIPMPGPSTHPPPAYHPGAWPMYYPRPYAHYQPHIHMPGHALGGVQASNNVLEEPISPTNTSFNVPGAGPQAWDGPNGSGGNLQGGDNTGGRWEQGNGGNEDVQAWRIDAGDDNNGSHTGKNGRNGPDQNSDWNEGNNPGDAQGNAANDWDTAGNEDTQNKINNTGDGDWENNNNDPNGGRGGGENWENGNCGNNNNNADGDAWAALDNTNTAANGADWSGDADNAQSGGADVARPSVNGIPRELYGPHGPYYSLRTLRLDEPRPDAEEEPRYDVPQSLATERGSTKQVQPGPGYRYFKKRMIPYYIDSMETPYARFVFKYRTKDQVRDEVGIEIDVEPSGDQEIQEYQNLNKQDLINLLIRAKSALGGKFPSPPMTPSTPTGDSEIGLLKAVDAPSYPYLKYTLPALRPTPGNTQRDTTSGSALKGEEANKENDATWTSSEKVGDDWNNNRAVNENAWGQGTGSGN